jgi:ribonuclease HI
MGVTIHIDGAARGNPGPAAFAYVISSDGRTPIEEKGCVGTATNNVAEYTALVRALERAAEIGADRVLVYSDSELLVKQMNGQYRVKNDNLRVLADRAKRLGQKFDSLSIRHVRREQNRRADQLCNDALDGQETPARPPARRQQPRRALKREEIASEEAVACLRAAAQAWADSTSTPPSPEEVWAQLWSILEENGLVSKRKR